MYENEKGYLIVDVHVHPKRRGVLIVDEILNVMDEDNVKLSILLARDTDPNDLNRPDVKDTMVEKLRRSDFLVHMGMDDFFHVFELFMLMRERLSRTVSNVELANIVKQHPGRFLGLGSINLCKSEEYVRDKLREIDELSLAGAKFWPQLQFFNPAESENYRIVCEHFQKKGKIIMMHTGTCPGPWEIPELSEDANPKLLEPVLRDYDVQVIIAHFGYYSATCPGIWFKEALELGRKYANVWFDISAVAYILREEKIVEAIRNNVGFDKVLFGSDYIEYVKPSIDIIINNPHLKENEKERILGLNAVELFKLKM